MQNKLHVYLIYLHILELNRISRNKLIFQAFPCLMIKTCKMKICSSLTFLINKNYFWKIFGLYIGCNKIVFILYFKQIHDKKTDT